MTSTTDNSPLPKPNPEAVASLPLWQRPWYGHPLPTVGLRPLEALVQRLARRRRRRLAAITWKAPVPVIVVGNLVVGGAGKTPLVRALALQLREAGWRPGLLSRGYGGRAFRYPLLVTAETDPRRAGDEAPLLARHDFPVVVAPDRVDAARYLLASSDCNLLIADDGLQHYRLGRDLEVMVVDLLLGLGNGRCLPAGPLREPPSRLREADFIVVHGPGQLEGHCVTRMELRPRSLVPLAGGPTLPPDHWSPGTRVHAVAGIGNPGRFFATLEKLGLKPVRHPFPDHHRYRRRELRLAGDLPLVMTEKDAVKCREMGLENAWFLEVEAGLEPDFLARLQEKLGAPP